MKSFDEATRQVANLMAAAGGNVDAYEDDYPPSTPPPAPHPSSFEAAFASVEAHLQCNEAPTGRIHPQDSDEANFEATGKTRAELIREMAEISEQLGGLTEDPFVEDSVAETTPTPEEEAFFERWEKVTEECESRDTAGVDWECMTGEVWLANKPDPVEEGYVFFGSVYKPGAEELKEIYNAFVFAMRTGEPQQVTLDSGTYEMTPTFGGDDWELHDPEKGRKYVQQSNHACVGGYEQIEEGDLFVWVIPDDREDIEDLGYLHNQWVFIREEE